MSFGRNLPVLSPEAYPQNMGVFRCGPPLPWPLSRFLHFVRRPATSLRTKTKLVELTPSGRRASWVFLRVQCCPRPSRSVDALSRKSVREHLQSGWAARRWQLLVGVLLPSRFVAGAVLAGVRLSPRVSSSSPVVAAVRFRVAACQWVAGPLASHRPLIRAPQRA